MGLILGPAWVGRATTGLGVCAFLFFPLLVVAPMGAAPLLAVAGLLSIAAGKREGFRPWWKGNEVTILFGVLMVWAAASIVWSVNPMFSVIETVRIGAMWLLGAALLNCSRRLGPPEVMRIRSLFVKGTLVALALLVPGEILMRLDLIERVVPFNRFSLILATGLGPLLAPFVVAGRIRAALALAAVVLTAILVMDSTTAKVSVFVGLAAGLVFFLRPKWAGPAVGVAYALMVVTAPLTFPKIADSAQATEEMAELKQSAVHRAEIWRFVGERIDERPLFGWGMNSSRVIPGGKVEIRPGAESLPLHPHNAPLQIWLELGAPGAALFAAMSFLLWKRLGASGVDRWTTAGRAAAMGAAFVSMIPGYGVWQEWWQASLWFLAFIALLDDMRTDG